MAERSSELDRLNDFTTTDRTDEIGTARTTVTTTSSERLDDDDTVRELSTTRRTGTDIATTADATEVDTTDVDAATTSASPTDAVLDPAAEPEEIRASIEQTRTEMSETINAIQEKLSISNIAGQVRDEVSEQISGAYESAKSALFGATVGKAGGFMEKVSKTVNQFTEDYGPALSEAGTTVVRSAKRNPVPFALIGLGVGLLLLGGSRKKATKVKSYRYAENYDDDLDFDRSNRSRRSRKSYTRSTSNRDQESTASKAYNRVGGVASSAYEGVSNAAGSAYSGVSSAASSALSGVSSVASSAYDKVGNLGGGAKQAARWTQETYERQLEENPFAVGGVAFALGAVIGLALPSTQVEGQLMGETRENLLRQAQDAAGGLIDKAQQVAGEVTRTVREEAKSQGITG